MHWHELCFLYLHYDEFDNAANCMIEHSTDAWEHVKFKDTMAKVANLEICYKAIDFYIDEQPTMINDLLTVMAPRVDHVRVVQQIRRAGHLPLIQRYLTSI